MARYDIDTAHSRLEFSARHLMVATVRGHFDRYSGWVEEEGGRPLRAEGTVEVASVNTGVGDRDNHLRSADFFDAENHPQMSFRSTAIEPDGDDSYRVTGDLTIRGTTKPITLDVEVSGRIKDPWGNDRVGVSATGKLNRKDYGLNWNQVIEAGAVVVGDTIKLQLDLSLVTKLEAAQQQVEAETKSSS